MMLLLLDFLYLDGYNSLWDKYTDRSNVTREQHNWIVDNKREFENQLYRNRKFKQLYNFRKAYRDNDWDVMLEMMLEYWEVEDNV